MVIPTFVHYPQHLWIILWRESSSKVGQLNPKDDLKCVERWKGMWAIC